MIFFKLWSSGESFLGIWEGKGSKSVCRYKFSFWNPGTDYNNSKHLINGYLLLLLLLLLEIISLIYISYRE